MVAATLQVEVATHHRHLAILLTRIMAHHTVGTHHRTLPQQLTPLQKRPMLRQQQLTPLLKRPMSRQQQLTLLQRLPMLLQLIHTPLRTLTFLPTQRHQQLIRPRTLKRAQPTSLRHLPTRPRAPFRRRLCTTQQLTAPTRILLPILTPITTRQQPRLTHHCTLTTGHLTITIRMVITPTHSLSFTMMGTATTSTMVTMATMSTLSTSSLKALLLSLSVEVLREEVAMLYFSFSLDAISAVAATERILKLAVRRIK